MIRGHDDVKDAFAEALGTRVIHLNSSGRHVDDRSLREIIVPCEPALEVALNVAGLPGRLPDVNCDLLLADVIIFCPVPMKVWQQRAHEKLGRLVTQWRNEIARVRTQLGPYPAYSVPFVHVLAAPNENEWVSDVKPVNIKPFDFDTKPGAAAVNQIVYFRRPFVVWPQESPGSRIHVSFARPRPKEGERADQVQPDKVWIERPDLYDRDLDPNPPVVKTPAPEPTPEGSIFRRWFRMGHH